MSKSLTLPLVVAALAAVALVGTLVAGGVGGSAGARDQGSSSVASVSTPTQSAVGDDPLAKLPRRRADDPMALGKVDAPVVLVAYSEFQCPFCGRFARDTQPTLVKEYVERGILRIEWRDFPYLGPESTTAALGGRAAAAQGKFWEFERAMYADPLPPNSGRLDEAHLVKVARSIGLDTDRFRADLGSSSARTAVDADFREGQALGVTGTPAFVINGTPVIGAQPTEVFQKVIEQAAGQ